MLTLLLLLAIGGPFVVYRVEMEQRVQEERIQRRQDSLEAVRLAAKQAEERRLAEERARQEERIQRRQDSLEAVRLAAKQAEERRLAEERARQEAAEAAARAATGTLNGHEWVDLGLSVLWATCNVGASNPSDYGGYYAWGETTTKSSYTEDNSRTYEVSMGDISGNPQYDAATANWGSGWRMPTEAELEELEDKCDWEWTRQGGSNGYKVTGPNGNSIFLPAAGRRDGTSLYNAGVNGGYCGSSPLVSESDTLLECILFFYSGYHSVVWDYRYYGGSVRPVSDK